MSKVKFILQDSLTDDIGVVVDCCGSIPPSPDLLLQHEKYEAIGTWQRLTCGIVIELTTTIEARQDVLINHIKEISESHRKQQYNTQPIQKYKKEVKEQPIKKDTHTKQFESRFEELRSKLKSITQ